MRFVYVFALLCLLGLAGAVHAQALSDASESVLNPQSVTGGGTVASAGDGGVLVSTVGQPAAGFSTADLGDVLSSGVLSPGFTLWADGDNDGDGMPNGYESEHGFDPDDPTDAADDEDGDGMTNLEEYQAGSDPEDPEDPPEPVPLYPWLAVAALGAVGVHRLRRR